MNENLSDQILKLLPQTHCTKCGYASCRDYADALANEVADINQCATGGARGISRLAQLLNKPVLHLNPQHGIERARTVAFIDEALCIGCTFCIAACPVDAIVGAKKMTHTALQALCTGCDLCLAACPVDCIKMLNASKDKTGWDAWSPEEADHARSRYELRKARLIREIEEEQARLNPPVSHTKPAVSKEETLRAALERARSKTQQHIQKR